MTKFNLSPKPVTITFVNFAVFGLTSIRQLPEPLRPLSYTASVITVIFSTWKKSLNYPISSRFRTLLLVYCHYNFQSHVISLPSYALSTGAESLNASNTISSHLPTKFPQLPNLHIFITLSLVNVLAVLTLHQLLLLGHRHHPF